MFVGNGDHERLQRMQTPHAYFCVVKVVLVDIIVKKYT